MLKGEAPLVPRKLTLAEQLEDIPVKEFTRSYLTQRSPEQKLKDEIRSLRHRAAATQSQLEELNLELNGIYFRLAEKMAELAKISE